MDATITIYRDGTPACEARLASDGITGCPEGLDGEATATADLCYCIERAIERGAEGARRVFGLLGAYTWTVAAN